MKKQTETPNDNQIRKTRQVNELKGLILIVLGLFLLAAYAGLSTGSAGALANDILRYGFGLGALLIPLLFVLLGVSFFRSTKNPLWSWGFLAGLVFYLCFSGFLHHIFIPAGEELATASLPEGGGLLGALIAAGLHKILGTAGAVLVLLVGMAGSLILTGRLSLRALAARAEDTFQSVREARREKAVDSPGGVVDETEGSPAADGDGVGDKGRFSLPLFNRQKDAEEGGILDVYQDEEFSAYNQGVRKESPFKKILHLGRDSGINGKDSPVRQPEGRPAAEDSPYGTRQTETPADSAERPALIRVCPEKQETVILQPSAGGPEVDPEPAPWELDALIPVTGEMERQAYPAGDPGHEIGGASGEERAGENRTRFILTPHGMQAVRTTSAAEIAGDRPAAAGGAAQAEERNETLSAGSLAEAEEKAAPEETAAAKKKDAYIFPPLSLLNEVTKSNRAHFDADVREQCKTLEKTLADFRVNARVIGVTRGPSVTRFELEPAPGVKVSSVVNLADDIALRLAAPGVRVEAPIPGKAAIGIEAPNIRNEMVGFKEVVDAVSVREDGSRLCIGLGKDISGNVITIDLAKMPHLLVAGSTGSGKSVCINTLLAGILYKARPDEVKLILVDPKVVELTNYNGIPHLLVPVVTDAKKAASALHWAVAEMERRYQSFADNRVRDIRAYNEQAVEKMPFIVIVIDEMSDLMMVAKADVEDAILRLAQKARACGIHLVLATQRPSVDVITGIVKANIPSRIAFAVSSQTDSRTILDMGGAEKLLGKGDMLFYPIGANKPLRVQGAFVSDAELNRVTDFVKAQGIPVEYSEEVTSVVLPSDSQKEDKSAAAGDPAAGEAENDELLDEAIRLVLDLGQASSSMLQRRFRIGYNRAARLVDAMEELGIVGPAVGSKPRELKMSRQEVERIFLSSPDEGR